MWPMGRSTVSNAHIRLNIVYLIYEWIAFLIGGTILFLSNEVVPIYIHLEWLHMSSSLFCLSNCLSSLLTPNQLNKQNPWSTYIVRQCATTQCEICAYNKYTLLASEDCITRFLNLRYITMIVHVVVNLVLCCWNIEDDVVVVLKVTL